MFTSALRADQYLDAQIKCVVGALNLLESQLATALVAVRRGWWLNKGTHERLIPTAPNIDSLGDSQIRESLTRCWLLKEEQHRWVQRLRSDGLISVSYTHLRAHETGRNLVCRLLLEKKKKTNKF